MSQLQTQAPGGPPPVLGPGPGYFPKPPNAADLKKMEIAGNLERDRRKAIEERRHDILQGGLTAQRDQRLAQIDAAHTKLTGGIQLERDARQAGYASYDEQQKAQARAQLSQQEHQQTMERQGAQNQFTNEHAALLNQFQQGRDYTQAGYENERDYRRAVLDAHARREQNQFTAERDQWQAARDQQAAQEHFRQQQALSEQGAGQQIDLATHHANLSARLHEVNLSATERADMQRMENSRSRMRQDLRNGVIDQRTHDIGQQRLSTGGYDEYQARHAESQQLMDELQWTHFHLQNKSLEESLGASQTFRAQTAQQRLQSVRLPNGRAVSFMPDAHGTPHQVQDPSQNQQDAHSDRQSRVYTQLAQHVYDSMNKEIQDSRHAESQALTPQDQERIISTRPDWHSNSSRFNEVHRDRTSGLVANANAFIGQGGGAPTVNQNVGQPVQQQDQFAPVQQFGAVPGVNQIGNQPVQGNVPGQGNLGPPAAAPVAQPLGQPRNGPPINQAVRDWAATNGAVFGNWQNPSDARVRAAQSDVPERLQPHIARSRQEVLNRMRTENWVPPEGAHPEGIEAHARAWTEAWLRDRNQRQANNILPEHRDQPTDVGPERLGQLHEILNAHRGDIGSGLRADVGNTRNLDRMRSIVDRAHTEGRNLTLGELADYRRAHGQIATDHPALSRLLSDTPTPDQEAFRAPADRVRAIADEAWRIRNEEAGPLDRAFGPATNIVGRMMNILQNPDGQNGTLSARQTAAYLRDHRLLTSRGGEAAELAGRLQLHRAPTSRP